MTQQSCGRSGHERRSIAAKWRSAASPLREGGDWANILVMTATAHPHHAGTRTAVALDGASLTIFDVLEVARGKRTVAMSERAAQAVRSSCSLKHELIEREIPIYGVTTGFGDS